MFDNVPDHLLQGPLAGRVDERAANSSSMGPKRPRVSGSALFARDPFHGTSWRRREVDALVKASSCVVA